MCTYLNTCGKENGRIKTFENVGLCTDTFVNTDGALANNSRHFYLNGKYNKISWAVNWLKFREQNVVQILLDYISILIYSGCLALKALHEVILFQTAINATLTVPLQIRIGTLGTNIH